MHLFPLLSDQQAGQEGKEGASCREAWQQAEAG